MDDEINEDFKKKLNEKKHEYVAALTVLREKFDSEKTTYLTKQEEISSRLAGLKDQEDNARKKVQQAKGQARLKLEREIKQLKEGSSLLRELGDENKKRLDELSTQLKEILQKEKEVKVRSARIEATSREAEIREYTERYRKKYEKKPTNDVYYDKESGRIWIKFNDSGNKFPLHRHIYYTRIRKIGLDEEVHHIDNNELNNEIWNLIALPKEKHNKNHASFHHKIEKNNWLQGLEVLIKELGLKNEDLPEHIRQHLKSEQEQTRLN
jgi:hypothetical protein